MHFIEHEAGRRDLREKDGKTMLYNLHRALPLLYTCALRKDAGRRSATHAYESSGSLGGDQHLCRPSEGSTGVDEGDPAADGGARAGVHAASPSRQVFSSVCAVAVGPLRRGRQPAAGSRGGSEVPRRVGDSGTGAGGAEGEGAAAGSRDLGEGVGRAAPRCAASGAVGPSDELNCGC